jgi:hypothetical protein
MTKAQVKVMLSAKNKQLIVRACDLLEKKKELNSDWNRLIKPELIQVFDLLNSNHLTIQKEKFIYSITKDVKEINIFSQEDFKKDNMDLFKKFSTKSIRTTYTHDIKELI